MADNSSNRKKALIVSVLAFLLAGGGVFLFFIIQGSNDLTGANKKNFYYGSAARGAATSFFKFLGFDAAETISNPGNTQRNQDRTIALEKAGTELASAGGSASGSGSDDAWGVNPNGGRSGSSSPTTVPRMGGGGAMSGVGGASAGGTKSSGGVSRFGEGADSGNVKISGKSLASAAATGNAKGTLGALQNARAMLGEGLRSGSAMTAKGKWDASFGIGGGGRGGKELAYGKSGLVALDKIKSGEVDSLKTTDIKSLKTADVKGFKEDKDANVQLDSASQKAKENAEDSLKKSAAEALANEAVNSVGNSKAKADPQAPEEMKTQAEGMKLDSDKSVGFKATTCGEGCPADAQGKQVFNMTFSGTGPGNMAGNEDKTVNYQDTYKVYMGNDGQIHSIPDTRPMTITTMSEVPVK